MALLDCGENVEDFFKGARAAEQIALKHVAAGVLQELCLLVGLHAFGQGIETHPAHTLQYAGHNGLRGLQGTLPTIMVSFADAKGTSFEELRAAICDELARAWRVHAHEVDYAALGSYERDLLRGTQTRVDPDRAVIVIPYSHKAAGQIRKSDHQRKQNHMHKMPDSGTCDSKCMVPMTAWAEGDTNATVLDNETLAESESVELLDGTDDAVLSEGDSALDEELSSDVAEPEETIEEEIAVKDATTEGAIAEDEAVTIDEDAVEWSGLETQGVGDDSYDRANSLAVNKTVSRSLINNDDEDWYKFTTASNGYITLTFGRDYSDAGSGWTVYLYRSDGTSVLDY